MQCRKDIKEQESMNILDLSPFSFVATKIARNQKKNYLSGGYNQRTNTFPVHQLHVALLHFEWAFNFSVREKAFWLSDWLTPAKRKWETLVQ